MATFVIVIFRNMKEYLINFQKNQCVASIALSLTLEKNR